MYSTTTSLFEDAVAWRAEPHHAFDAFLASDTYKTTNRSSSKLPADHCLSGSSAAVYQVMFRKYLAFAKGRNCSFAMATPGLIDEFLNQELGRSSKDTRTRYARLLERAYTKALEVGAVDANPVTAFTITSKVGGENKMPPYAVRPIEVVALQAWLSLRVQRLLASDADINVSWRPARDAAMAAICLGAGLRCAELTAMRFKQLTYKPGAPAAERFAFDIPTYASVPTSKFHQAVASAASVDAMEAWWSFRAGRMQALIKTKSENDIVFPSGLNDKKMQISTLFTNLSSLAANAVDEGALDASRSWVLTTGATGLRRAFIMSSLSEGRDPDLMTARLGHWDSRSIRRYSERAALVASMERHSARTAAAS